MDNKRKYGNVFILLSYLKEYIGYLILYIFVGMIYRALPIILSFILSYVLGLIFEGKEVWNGFFIIIVICVLLRTVGRYVDTWISHDIAYRILAKLRIKLYRKIESLSPAFLTEKRTGVILSVMKEDVDLLEWFYAHTFGVFIINISLIFMLLFVLYSIHPFLVLAVIPWLAPLIIVHVVFRKRRAEEGKKVRELLGVFGAEISDGIQGIKDITAYNWQEEYKEKLLLSRSAYEKARLKDGKRRGLESGLAKGIMAMTSISALCMAVWLNRMGVLTPKWYLVAVTISGSIVFPIAEMLNMSLQFGVIFAAAQRVLSILRQKPVVTDSGTKQLMLAEEFSIKFDDVWFKYPDEKDYILKGVSFKIHSGETIALAGVSGSGKSTIVKLLQRFYETDKGVISIAGEKISAYTLSSLRNEIAIVPQEVYLFHTSLLDNIRMGREDAADWEIQMCSRRAMVNEFAEDLPKGYLTNVGEMGVRLSGGQKQRIAIARALLKNSKILVLDEASSSLDSNSEECLNKTINEIKREKTVIMIAHRTSTLREADRIIFIKDGKVDAIGKYEDLIKENSSFNIMTGNEMGAK